MSTLIVEDTAHDPANQPCLVCGVNTRTVCGYCGRSLGCAEHLVAIETHVEALCLAGSADQRAAVAEAFAGNRSAWRAIVDRVRVQAPRPWPMPPVP